MIDEEAKARIAAMESEVRKLRERCSMIDEGQEQVDMELRAAMHRLGERVAALECERGAE